MAEARRGRGWGAALALGLFAMLVSAIHPALLIAVPLALLMIALPPLRSPYRLIGIVLLVLLFTAPRTGTLWYAERGWALMLGASFLAVVVLFPRARFIGRAVAALAGSATIAGIVLLSSGAWSRVEWSVAQRFREAATYWTARLGASPDTQVRDLASTFEQIAAVEVLIYPAMLGLASVAALAVAWWAYRRLVERSAATLGPLREFRFADHLVWVLILGAALLIVPLGDAAMRAGVNLTAFMAALYVLRGAAVVVALAAPGGLALFVMVAVAVLMLPFVAGAALIVGLTDTWLDLRARRRAEGDTGS